MAAKRKKQNILEKKVREIKKVIERPTTTDSRSKVKFSKKYIVLFVVLVLLIAGIFKFKGFFVAATVNGTPITRIALIQELERQAGQQALDSLVTKTLILQEASKQHISISGQELTQDIKNVENDLSAKGQKLDALLAAQGMTREQFADRLKIQKIVEKLLAKDVAVSDSEIQDYIKKNRDNFPKDAKQTEMESQARQILQTQKLNEKFIPWLDNLKKNSKINYFI